MRRLPYLTSTVAATVSFSILLPLSAAAAPRRSARPAPKVEAPGSLVLAGDGRTKKGFTDFAGMDLVTQQGKIRPDGTVQWAKVRPRGTVHTTRVYAMTNIADDGLRLSFDTQAVRGVSYRFSGTWIHDAPSGTAVLKGKLTRLIKGATAAAADVEFVTEEGD